MLNVDFWGHELISPHKTVPGLTPLHPLWEPKVNELNVTIVHDTDVLWLKVAVANLFPVEIPDCVRHSAR